MAYDKIVDSAKLDAGMTATANAIRAKTGGSSAIPWKENTGFADAVGDISQAEDLSAELEAQDALISALEEAVAGKAAGGGTVDPPNIQPLSVTSNGTYTASGDVDGYSPIVVNVPSSGDSGGAIETCELRICLENAPNAYINYIWFAREIDGILNTTMVSDKIYDGINIFLLVAVGTPVTIRYYNGGWLVRALSDTNTEIVYEDYNNSVIVKCTKSGSASLILEGIEE